MTRASLRVLMIASSYPRSSDDTSSVFLRYLVEHLRKTGADIRVLAPADNSRLSNDSRDASVTRFRYLPRAWQQLAYGSGILPNLRRRPLLWLQVPFFLIGMAIALFRITRKWRPQIIHAHWVLPQGLIAVFVGAPTRVPVVVTLHGGDAFALKGGPLSWLKRAALTHAAAWTANTNVTANALRMTVGVPSPYIIPMGVDVKRFSSGHRETYRQDIPAKDFVILFVGRLVEKKGVDDLITAFSTLPEKLAKNTWLWIVGGGDEESNLRGLASRLGVSNKIKFWGTVPNTHLPEIYAAADVFVGPSVVAASGDTEGQGVVFLEAFSARLCVIAAASGGIAEVVDDGITGILVPPRDSARLAAAMETLLTNRELREKLAENAFRKVTETYAWEKVAGRFEALYRSIVTASRSERRSASR
jgi:glycosyltransferase involved in cell wall biosynthesis